MVVIVIVMVTGVCVGSSLGGKGGGVASGGCGSIIDRTITLPPPVGNFLYGNDLPFPVRRGSNGRGVGGGQLLARRRTDEAFAVREAKINEATLLYFNSHLNGCILAVMRHRSFDVIYPSTPCQHSRPSMQKCSKANPMPVQVQGR